MKRIHLFLIIVLLVVGGCHSQDQDPSNGGSGRSADSLSALQILQRMIKTYQAADSYQDQGILTLSYRYADEPRKDVSQAAVSWLKPNHLRLRAYQLSLTVDGDKLRARVADASTNNIGNQLLVRHAGEGTSLTDIYEDPLVKDVLIGGRGGQPVQLELLLQPPMDQSPPLKSISNGGPAVARASSLVAYVMAVQRSLVAEWSSLN